MSGAKFLVCFFLLTQFSFALNIDSYRIASEREGDSAHIALFIYVSNNRSEPVDSVVLSVPPDSQILSAGDFFGALAYTKSGASLRINASSPIKAGDTRLVFAELSSKEVLSGKSGYSEYLLIFDPAQDIADFEHTFRIKKFSGRVQFISPPAEVSFKDGGLLVRWDRPLKGGVAQPFILRFEEGRTDYTPAIALLILLAIAYLAHKASSKYLAARRKAHLLGSLKILNERERVVVEEVVRSPGVSQNKLQQKFGYAKASMSKIVGKLAYRGIIEKKKHGKTNFLYPGKKLAEN